MKNLFTGKKLFHKQYETDNGLIIDRGLFIINIFNGNDCIRISKKHKIYLYDITSCFEYYFSSVEPEKWGKYNLVDFSKRNPHKVKGFNEHKVLFSSFAEPIRTAQQYIDFAQLNSDSVVLDLGAYSGLTSILFDQSITKNNSEIKGRVIAVDPDVINCACIKKNFIAYKQATGRNIEYLHGAVWKTDGQIEFSSEGNMGASAICFVGKKRGKKQKVKSFTLNSIAQKYNLSKIDFIKCDVEGAEIYIFNDDEFFKKYSQKIIFESHCVDDNMVLSSQKVIDALSKYGYNCKEVPQEGTNLPLVECYPPVAVNKHEENMIHE